MTDAQKLASLAAADGGVLTTACVWQMKSCAKGLVMNKV